MLELCAALFSWDPIGSSQEIFISHLEVKKVRWARNPVPACPRGVFFLPCFLAAVKFRGDPGA